MTIKTCPNCTFITESEILMRWHICSFERMKKAEEEAEQLLNKVYEHDGTN